MTGSFTRHGFATLCIGYLGDVGSLSCADIQMFDIKQLKKKISLFYLHSHQKKISKFMVVNIMWFFFFLYFFPLKDQFYHWQQIFQLGQA